MMMRRWIVCAILFLLPLWAHADWAADRDASAGYVTVTTLATAIDEAVPFCVVYMSDLSADFWAAMDTASDTDGKTIRVSTSDGTTQLACVPIGVNTGTDTGCLIFLGTGMSASVDVDYRIYVGNASLTMPAASAGEQLVFASYAGVYFPGVDTRDWTAGGRTLTAVNSPGTAASGYEGITAATYTSASSQYHSYDGTPAIVTTPFTLEALATSSSTTTNQFICGIAKSSSNNNDQALIEFRGGQGGDPVKTHFQGNGAGLSQVGTSTGYTANTLQYAAVTRDAATGTSYVYRNGGSSGSDTTSLTAYSAPNRFGIGCRYDLSPDQFLDGSVAVVLLSSSVRSADYVSTMQDNWAGTMYSAGAWTALGSCNTGSTGWVLFQTIGQSTSAAADWSNTSDALVDDSNTADVTLDDAGVYESEYLNFTNPAYGTTIPTGADSYTVEFRIKRKSDTSSAKEVQDLTVQFIDDTGTRVGDNVAATSTNWPSALATAYPDYVATGLTLDGTEFDADSGLALRVTGVNTNGSTLTEVANAQIRVTWYCGDDAAGKARGFFALTE